VKLVSFFLLIQVLLSIDGNEKSEVRNINPSLSRWEILEIKTFLIFQPLLCSILNFKYLVLQWTLINWKILLWVRYFWELEHLIEANKSDCILVSIFNKRFAGRIQNTSLGGFYELKQSSRGFTEIYSGSLFKRREIHESIRIEVWEKGELWELTKSILWE